MSYFCGCYYHLARTRSYLPPQKHHLPLLSSTIHSTILSTTSRTLLTQTFKNPTAQNIEECIYTFPLYDGVSVVSFTCRIGKRVLRGLVKEKEKARKVFTEAVSRGETAGLLEQMPEASDVFATKLGNVREGETVIVEIVYVGELKMSEVEGVRFTVPTKIAPRYGGGPAVMGGLQVQEEGGIKITVDVNMADGSFIKGVQSPSHPIAVSMGTVSTASTADPVMTKASATLSLGSAALEKDFVLIVQSKDVGIPKAILETHPRIRNHRALMATLVPKFSLPPSRPEIVFVADRSGSMQHNMTMLISAMKVFLKSMPLGVKFNICSFGSSHSFLWPKSQSYSQETLQSASNHLVQFRADFGGTETFGAIKATIENRFTDIPLEIILLTDGDIWPQEQLFKYVNQQVEQTNGNIRVFPLGIGNGVSHSLIEGLARAGNGFAQAVQDGERLDNCVVRMLRGAMSPHITDYTLEVKYEKEEDDFELIDKVTEGMKVLLSEDKKAKKTAEKPAISLFDTNVEPETDDVKGPEDSSLWLPEIPFPKLYQAPHKIPTLFAFSRTSVYLLMSPETIQRNPTAVILRATSAHGPLALEIPIESLTTPAETIHQLAAKKAVQDLEEGRGWIYDAKDQNGVLIKDRHPSCFDELVKKDAVRLGEKFQIAGKWCSFVAVVANDKEIAEDEDKMTEQKSLVVDADGDILADMNDDLLYAAAKEAEEDEGEDDDDFHMAIFGSDVPDSKPTSGASKEKFMGMGSAATTIAMGQSSTRMSTSPRLPPGAVTAQPSSMKAGNSLSTAPASRSLGRAAPPPPLSPSAGPYGRIQSGGMAATATPKGMGAPSSYGAPIDGTAQVRDQSGASLPSSARSPPPLKQQAQYYQSSQTHQSRQYFGPGSSVLQYSSVPAPSKALDLEFSSSGQTLPKHDIFTMNDTPSAAQPAPISSTFSPAFGRGSPAQYSAPQSDMRRRSSFGSAPIILGSGGGRGGNTQARKRKISGATRGKDLDHITPAVDWSSKTLTEKVARLIELQTFDGSWAESEDIPSILGFKDGVEWKVGVDKGVWITLLVVKWLEIMASEEEGVWEMVVEKARGWLESSGFMNFEQLEQAAAIEIEKLK